jgi:quinol monooxygenase YgiN
MIHVMARITVKPESAAAAFELLTALVNATRKEAGCIGYELFQQVDAPHVYRTVEQWLDKVAVDAHMASPHVAAAIATGGPMFAMAPEILSFNKLM